MLYSYIFILFKAEEEMFIMQGEREALKYITFIQLTTGISFLYNTTRHKIFRDIGYSLQYVLL